MLSFALCGFLLAIGLSTNSACDSSPSVPKEDGRWVLYADLGELGTEQNSLKIQCKIYEFVTEDKQNTAQA